MRGREATLIAQRINYAPHLTVHRGIFRVRRSLHKTHKKSCEKKFLPQIVFVQKLRLLTNRRRYSGKFFDDPDPPKSKKNIDFLFFRLTFIRFSSVFYHFPIFKVSKLYDYFSNDLKNCTRLVNS